MLIEVDLLLLILIWQIIFQEILMCSEVWELLDQRRMLKVSDY